MKDTPSRDPHDGRPTAKPARRTRVSERALSLTLKAMQQAGVPVDRVCITGGQIEIHCAPIAQDSMTENDKGLEKW